MDGPIDLANLLEAKRFMHELIVIVLHCILKAFYQALQLNYRFAATLDLSKIYPILLFGQLLLL